MELQEFTEKVVQALQDFYGKNARIESHEIYKNNGLRLQGICALMPNKNVAPTIYLNHFYESFNEGEAFEKIIHQIIEIYEKNQISQNLDIDFFMDYHKVEKRLVLRLIHGSRNEELLKKVPYRPFHDLAVVCHCLIVNEAIGTGSILIHRHHLEAWEVSEEELFKAATANSPRLQPYALHKMGDLIREIMGKAVEDKVEEFCNQYQQDKEELVEKTIRNMVEGVEQSPVPMYILTNEGRYYGAASLLYEGVLEEMAKRLSGDFYILPSSVHEVILLPKRDEDKADDFSRMVKEVNTNQVEPEEWLSDHVYLYRQAEKRVVSLK